MKAEINNENKVKLFALYWGQKVLEYPKDNLAGRSGGIGVVGWMISTDVCVSGTLNLKPLSQISDEDAIKVSFMTASHFVKCLDSYGDEFNTLLLKHHHIDFLRSRGYALPWMGFSVEEMIEAGWIKLIEG